MKLKLIFGLIFLNVLVNAQENKMKEKMNSLSFLVSEWELSNYKLEDNTKWVPIETSRASFEFKHEGQFISETVKYITGFGEINMIIYFGFDYRINKFKLCAMDKEYGSMDVYYGEWIDNDLVFTNLKSDLPIKMQDGKQLSFKLVYSNIENNSFSHLVYGTYDNGNTWFPFSKSIYNKIVSENN